MNAADVHRRMMELFPDRLDEALALIDPDVIDHRGGTEGDHHGIEAWKRKWDRMFRDPGDLSVTVDQNVSSGDTSVNRYTMRGTDTGSGRHYEVYGLDMIRVRNGRLVEHWALTDTVAVQHQLTTGPSAPDRAAPAGPAGPA